MEANGGDQEQGEERAARGIARLPNTVIRLGAVAAAIGSILALVATIAPGIVPGGDSSNGSSSGTATTAPKREIDLTVPRDAARYATRQQYATAFVGDPHFYDDQPELAREPGVVVFFNVDWSGYARGTNFPLIITLFEHRQDGVRSAGRSNTGYQVGQTTDSCGCEEWVALRPGSRGPYTARVQLYPSDQESHADPLKTIETEAVRRPRQH